MISIVDYGLGNVQAIANIYRRLNIAADLVSSPAQLARATKVILPGVGAFDWAMGRLNDSGMREVLDDLVLNGRRPVLGICVGMQMMADGSDEGVLKGLGWIGGQVKRFDESQIRQQTHLPHMGWNDVIPKPDSPLFSGLERDGRFYFLHSYFFAPTDHEHVLAAADYHGTFAASVRRDRIFGAQFHPEKSHHWGIRLLKNFAEL